MSRPLVGIVGNSYVMDDGYPVQATGTMNLSAMAMVAKALPVMIPSGQHWVNVTELCTRFDGFLFTGGRPNVHPSEYGEIETKAHGAFDRERDGLTLPLIRAAVDAGLPILGICRGFQEFNVAFGGSLHPEIRDLPGRMNHRMPPDSSLDEKFAHRHMVQLSPDGVFAQIFGSDAVMTNSLHGQGIKTAGTRVLVEGYAPDDTAEAIRIKDAIGFALAVQWHPEYQADKDDVSRPLFEAFGHAMRDYASSKD